MFFVARQVLFSHFLRVKDVNLRLAVVDLYGKRRDQIGAELVHYALLGDKAHVVFVPARHGNERAVVGIGSRHLLLKALLHEF